MTSRPPCSPFRGKALSLLNAGLLLLAANQTHAAPNTPEGQTLPLSKAPVQIAKEGKALLPIVISPDRIKLSGTVPNPDPVKKTAEDLAAFLKRMTGADFSVEESKEARGITLGTLGQFPDEALKAPLALRETYNGLEAFSIRTDENRIRLIANTDLGVSHVAYRFLELLGCRWFFPTAVWEIIPQDANLSFQLNEDSRPDIWSRSIWFGRMHEDWEKGDPIPRLVYEDWKVRNRMGESLDVSVSHAWHGVALVFDAKYKKDFEAHPEYYALTDGKRPAEGQLCVTNPGLQKLMVDYALTYFEKNPTADMVPFDPADGAGWCECDDCKKLGHQSNQAFYLCNIVGKGIREKYPTKYVGVLAYSWHSDPPPFDLEPNVYVQLTSGMNTSKKSFDELFELWAKKCSHWGIYEYFSYWHADRGLWPGKPTAGDIDALAPRMKKYVQNNVNAISEESSNTWGLYGLGYYVANKAMWNVELDTTALKKDFYQKAFGPAAAPMESYYERLNHANNPRLGAALILGSLADLEKAATLAKGHPEILARLQALNETLIYNYLGFKTEAAAGGPDERDLMFAWLTWGYRARTNFMNNWSGQRASMGKDGMEKFGEDSWYIRKTRDNPWRDNTPITPQECSVLFQKIKEDFGPVTQVEKTTFSNQFSLVDFGKGDGVEISQKFSPEASCLLASLTGEPLKFTVTVGKVALASRDAKYSVTSSDGKIVSSGDLDGGDHAIEVKVAGPGVYRFTCRRGGPGWGITTPATLPVALLLTQDETLNPAIENGFYFYVPKGLKEIVFYSLPRATPVIRRPDGTVAYQEVSNGSLVTIPVGADSGKLWQISGRISDLWLFNVPRALSLNPSRVFVPQDIASKDGLKVVLE